MNLCQNAIDAMAQITGRERVLTISIHRAVDDRVEIKIGDTGAGMMPDHLARLTESFYTTKPNGLGLGLSISRSILQLHNGQLSFSSTPNVGTIVTVELPVSD